MMKCTRCGNLLTPEQEERANQRELAQKEWAEYKKNRLPTRVTKVLLWGAFAVFFGAVATISLLGPHSIELKVLLERALMAMGIAFVMAGLAGLSSSWSNKKVKGSFKKKFPELVPFLNGA